MQGQINNTTNKTNMMKITKLTSLAISAALAMAMTASAENSDKKGNRLESKGKRELPQRILEKFDTDGDGKLNESEKSELKKAMTQRRGEIQAKMLKRFDSDKDGSLSPEEKKAASCIAHYQEGTQSNPRSRTQAVRCRWRWQA
jgi:Ca2+-binding EF-hand superfamily protein